MSLTTEICKVLSRTLVQETHCDFSFKTEQLVWVALRSTFSHHINRQLWLRSLVTFIVLAWNSVYSIFQICWSCWWSALLWRLNWRRNLWVGLNVRGIWLFHFFDKHWSLTWRAWLHLDCWPVGIPLICKHLVLNFIVVYLSWTHRCSELDWVAQILLALLDLVKSVSWARRYQSWVFGWSWKWLSWVLHARGVVRVSVSLANLILRQILSNQRMNAVLSLTVWVFIIAESSSLTALRKRRLLKVVIGIVVLVRHFVLKFTCDVAELRLQMFW